MNLFKCSLLTPLLLSNAILFADSETHLSEDITAAQQASSKIEKDNHAETEFIEISAVAQKEASIKSTTLELQVLPKFIQAPGEVIPDVTLSSKITPRVAAQVVQRKVNIGDYVEIGQPMVTLSSTEIARAQSDLLLAYHEWQRVKILGEAAVGAKRYQTAEIDYNHAFSKLIAYGMTTEQVGSFLEAQDSAKATGEFTLLSTQNGTVYNANVIEGEMVEAGYELYHILDESSLWVEARLSNDDAYLVKKGMRAFVDKSEHSVKGEVVQVHHKLDEITRTQIVKISIPNEDDAYHPGEFVNCRILIGETEPVLAIPESALLRAADGDWVVYVEIKPNHFKQVEVNLVNTITNLAIISGVTPGTQVVTQGAFAVHSELLKTGFQAHSH